MSDRVEQLPTRLNDDLDRRLDEFDAGWSAGQRPDLERFIPSVLRTADIPQRPQWRRYVAELLTIDLEYRIRQSRAAISPIVEDYYDRIPWLSRDELVLMEVLPAEYMARHSYGDRPGLGEYQLRFPHLGQALADVLDEARTDLVLEDSGTATRSSELVTDSFSAIDVTLNDATGESAATIREGAAAPNAHLTRTFGGYEIQREIARGGMGIVYKAIQRALKRPVALKVILAGQFAQTDDVRRFHAEAEAAAKLDHPNIVPIYEVGRVEGHHFFSMAFVDGPSLSAEVADQPLDAARAALVLRDVADAIEYAHENGVIHRDLKPSNILLEGGRTPRITDFGLARQTNVESGMTVTGQILGTPSYMPPEQALGQIDRIDARSDVYSLGATLYCLLTGRGPFQAAGVVQTLAQVVQQEPVPPRRLNGDVPRDLENICLKCLSKSPDARYQSAGALRDDLNRFLSGKPTLARPLSSTERVLRFCRRNPGVSLLIALSTLLLVALAAVSLGAYYQTLEAFRQSESQRIEIGLKESQAQQEKQKAILAEQEAVRLRAGAEVARDLAAQQAEIAQASEARERATRIKFETALRRAEFNIYLNALQRTQQLWDEGQVEPSRQLHDGLRNLELWDEVNGWEWTHVGRLLHQEQAKIPAHDQPALAACWNPDGTLIASAGQDRTIKIWNPQTGRLHAPPLSGHQDWVWDVQFTNDGRQLLSVARDGEVRLWDVDKGVLVEIVAARGEPAEFATISADGRRWAAANPRGRVAVWDLERREELVAWEAPASPPGDASGRADPSEGAGRVTALALDDTGARVAIARHVTDNGQSANVIQVRAIDEDEPVVTLSGGDGITLAMAFRADADRLAAGGSSDRVQVWNFRTGERIGRWAAHRGSIYGVQFADNADQLLTCSADQTIGLWSVATESSLETFRGHTGPVFIARMHASGRDILSAGHDGQVRLWQPGRDHSTLRDLSPLNVVFPAVDNSGLHYLADRTLHEVTFPQLREPVSIVLPGQEQPTHVIRLPGAQRGFALAAGQSVLLCDAEGASLTELPALTASVHQLCASADGERLAIADVNGLLQVYDLATATRLWEFSFETRLAALTFCNDDPLQKRDRTRLLAVDLDGVARMFDRETGRIEVAGQFEEGARSVSISPAAPLVALGGRDGMIRLYDTDTFALVSQLNGHQGLVNAVRFSPDGKRLASAGSDRMVRIWAPAVRTWAPDQEALLLTLRGHARSVQHVFWTNHQAAILSVDSAGGVIRWRTRQPALAGP